MVEELSRQYPVRELCLVLQVTRSGYYAWCSGPETARQAANRLLTEEIRRVHQQKKGRYGSPRITEQLRRQGHRCNHKRVERLMRQNGLRGCSSRKRRVCTTDSDHDQPVAPNLLLERAAPSRPNEVWARSKCSHRIFNKKGPLAAIGSSGWRPACTHADVQA